MHAELRLSTPAHPSQFHTFLLKSDACPEKADSEREQGREKKKRKKDCPQGFEATASMSFSALERDLPAGIMKYSYYAPFHTPESMHISLSSNSEIYFILITMQSKS